MDNEVLENLPRKGPRIGRPSWSQAWEGSLPRASGGWVLAFIVEEAVMSRGQKVTGATFKRNGGHQR